MASASRTAKWKRQQRAGNTPWAEKTRATAKQARRDLYKDPVWAAAERERQKMYKRAARSKVAKESVIETYFCDRIADAGGMTPKFKDLGRRGAPDRLAILPGHPTYYVELKRPRGGKLYSWQTRYHEDLRACGQHVWVLNTHAAVDGFMAGLLV
jgi:hypothetical protein